MVRLVTVYIPGQPMLVCALLPQLLGGRGGLNLVCWGSYPLACTICMVGEGRHVGSCVATLS